MLQVLIKFLSRCVIAVFSPQRLKKHQTKVSEDRVNVEIVKGFKIIVKD